MLFFDKNVLDTDFLLSKCLCISLLFKVASAVVRLYIQQ